MSGPKGTAVVTGATGGVGALYAAGLAERGYDLVLVGRQQKTLEAAARAVKQKANVKVETLVAALAQAKDLAHVEARISSDPAITALINNAGAASFGPFAPTGPAAPVSKLVRFLRRWNRPLKRLAHWARRSSGQS